MIFSRTYFIPSAVTFSIRVWFAVQNLIFVHPCKKVYRRSSKSNFFGGSESFFFPNLKQRAQHAFSVNYIPSIIEKKNLAVVWLQCVSSSAWAGEAQFDYRSDFFFFFVQTDECDTEHWYQLKYFACPPVRLFSLQSQCTARIRGNKAAKAGTRIYIYCKKTKLELPASHSRRLSSLLS